MSTSQAHPSEIIGQIRIQPLGPHLLRIEQKGAGGFEDRATFTIQDRPEGFRGYQVARAHGTTTLSAAGYAVCVPGSARSYEDVRVRVPNGQWDRTLGPADLQRSFLPSPSDLPEVWILADHPRVVPPRWGALPPPEEVADQHSGWDLENGAPDLYVFFPKASGYEAFRKDYLRLTGAIPLPPLYAFGLWYSRYHPYGEDTALDVIERFRQENIPLDVFVVDTDWRVGASCGYQVHAELFPDMERFIRRAHEQKVRVMFNDHPEPVGKHALAPEELAFRFEGLTSLLKQGADVWWFDRNWHTHLQSPVEGLNKEVWGMRLYHDITQAHAPRRRPLIMSNVDGINNGRLEAPSHPAAHRYPIWWTGDTLSDWEALRAGVQNGVDSGIVSLLPYVHEDLGGHHGQPDAEYYTRFMQFGAFSPIARIHCTAQRTRYPWFYGRDTKQIVGEFFRLRYRLLPTIYAAAHEAHRSGLPLLRRCDLEWPQVPEAKDSTQYLFGDDLLVAPIMQAGDLQGTAARNVWIPEGEWTDAWSGKTHIGPARIEIACPLEQCPLFVRRGGVVISLPQSYFTEGRPWDHVVLNAFVPAKDSSATRLLYEDDGNTTDYTHATCGQTLIRLERTPAGALLAIEPSAEYSAFMCQRRTWTVRWDVPKGQTVRGVSLNGKPLAQGAYTVHAPSAGPMDRIFMGAGAAAPSEGGEVVEVEMKDVPSGQRWEVRLAL